MASPTQWTWVWASSRSWWWTGRPGVLWFIESQSDTTEWVTELNWTELIGSSNKQESSKKKSTSALLTTTKPLTVCITTNCGKLFKRQGYQATLPASWEICMQVKKQQLEPDMEQWNWFQIGKGVHQGCILSSCLFILYAEYIVQNPFQTGMKHKMESRLKGDTSITPDMQMTPPL